MEPELVKLLEDARSGANDAFLRLVVRRKGRPDDVHVAKPGEPLILEGKVTQVRKSDTNVFARYAFEFFQNEKLVYTGEQSAMWMKVAEATAERELISAPAP